jgi:hypothetical protein
MQLSKNIANTIALSSAFFIGCQRDFDPVEYHRAEPVSQSRHHQNEKALPVSLEELCNATHTESLASAKVKFIAPGTLVQVNAWLYADSKERSTQRGDTLISFKAFLNEVGPDFYPYPKYQSLDPSPELTIKSPLLHAALHFPLFTESEVKQLKGPGLTRDLVEKIHASRDEKAMLLSRQFYAGEYNGYCKIIGEFGNDGIFNIVEISRLDLVNP